MGEGKGMKKKLSFAAMAVVIFFSFLQTSFAIYQWVDEKGVVHITDYPKPGSQPAEEEKVSTPPVELPAKTEPLPEARPMRQQPLSGEKKQAPAPAPGTPAPKSTVVAKPTASSPGALPQQAAQGVESSPVKTAQPAPQQLPAGREMPGPGQPAAGQANMPSQQAVAAFVAAFALFILAASAALYLYSSLCIFLIARKLNVSGAWTAWLPIIQIWALIASAGKPCWWVLLLFIPFANIIVAIYLWMCITENLGRGKALGLLMLVPVVNLIMLGVLAFSGEGSGPRPVPAQ